METLKFETSLKCGGCVAAIQPKMDELNNVSKWEVDLTKPIKVLFVEGEALNEDAIIAILKDKGFSATKI
jgi:copper chaperone